MAKPFPLQPLLHLAEQENDAATRKLGKLNQQRQTAQSRLDTLQQYRKDYQQRFQEAYRNGMSHADLTNFQNFIYRLDEAIIQQNGTIKKADALVSSGRAELMQAQRKMKSFDTLAQRFAASERQKEEKYEQKLTDEFAGRKSSVNTSRNDN